MCDFFTGEQQTQSTFQPPRQVRHAGYQALDRASELEEQGYTVPTQQIAGFTPDQMQSFDTVRDAQGIWKSYFDEAGNYGRSAANFITKDNIEGYLNPWAEYAMAALNDDIGSRWKNQQGNLVQSAGGVGADRIAVGQSEGMRQNNLARGSLMGDFWARALAAAQQQKGREANAATQLAGLGEGSQRASFSDATALYGSGTAQQGLEQTKINADYAAALANLDAPWKGVERLSNVVGRVGPALGGTTTNTYPAPSILSQMTGLIAAGAGAAGNAGSFMPSAPTGGNMFGGGPSVGFTGNTTNPFGGVSGATTSFMGGVPYPMFAADGGRVEDQVDWPPPRHYQTDEVDDPRNHIGRPMPERGYETPGDFIDPMELGQMALNHYWAQPRFRKNVVRTLRADGGAVNSEPDFVEMMLSPWKVPHKDYGGGAFGGPMSWGDMAEASGLAFGSYPNGVIPPEPGPPTVVPLPSFGETPPDVAWPGPPSPKTVDRAVPAGGDTWPDPIPKATAATGKVVVPGGPNPTVEPPPPPPPAGQAFIKNAYRPASMPGPAPDFTPRKVNNGDIWDRLLEFGLGTLAASGERDGRGLPMSGLGAIGKGGMAALAGKRKDTELDQKNIREEQRGKEQSEDATIWRARLAETARGHDLTAADKLRDDQQKALKGNWIETNYVDPERGRGVRRINKNMPNPTEENGGIVFVPGGRKEGNSTGQERLLERLEGQGLTIEQALRVAKRPGTSDDRILKLEAMAAKRAADATKSAFGEPDSEAYNKELEAQRRKLGLPPDQTPAMP